MQEGGGAADEDREAGGPGGCGQRSLDFIKSRWEDTGHPSKENHDVFAVCRGWVRDSCWEARLGEDGRGSAVGRGDSERKRVSVSGCGRVGWQRGRQEEISF